MLMNMSWTKIFVINTFVFICLLIVVETFAGAARVIIGKEFLFNFSELLITSRHNQQFKRCTEMATHTSLGYRHFSRGECYISGGRAVGDYVVYDSQKQNQGSVLTLGGSTTDGFYQHISDGDTWPKILSESLAKYKVINGGVGGYDLLQETTKFFLDGPRFRKLKYVISLNGINDLPDDYEPSEKDRSSLYPFLTDTQHQMNMQQRWVDARISGPLYYLLPNLQSLLSFIYSKVRTQTPGSSIDKNAQLSFRTVNAVERWHKNITRLHSLVLLEGAEFIVFLQPTMGLEGPQSQPPAGSADEALFKQMDASYINTLNDFYSAARLKCKSLTYCHDLSQVAPDG